MITRDSRKKPGKRLHHALEDVVGLKQGAFHRLASTTRRVILCEKIVKSVAGDRTQTVQFALAFFDKSRLLCKDAKYVDSMLCLLHIQLYRCMSFTGLNVKPGIPDSNLIGFTNKIESWILASM